MDTSSNSANPAASTSNIKFSFSPKSTASDSDANETNETNEPKLKRKRPFLFESFRNSPSRMTHVPSISNLSVTSSSIIARSNPGKSKESKVLMALYKYLLEKPLSLLLQFAQLLSNPESKLAAIWVSLIMFVSAYNFLGVTFRCTFLYTYRLTWYSDPVTVGVLAAIDLICDFIYFLDMVLGFVSPYNGDDGLLVFNVKKTLWRYISPRKGWFWIDLITFLPLDLVPLIFWTHLVPYFRLNRALRLLFKFLHYFSYYENYVNITSSITRIFKFICIVLLITHCVTCLWYLISISEEPQNTIMWTNIEGLPYRSIWEIYLYAFHWGLVTMTGYGGTISASFIQVVFSEVVVGIGVAMFVTVIGTLGSLVTNLDSNASKNRQKLDEIKEYMKYRKLPSNITHRIVNYYTFLFKSRKGWDEEKILNDLPQYLRVEVALDMNRKIVEKVELFKNSSRMFIGSVVLSLMPRMTLPGTAIVRRGEIGREMYFIATGVVHILSPKDDKTVLVKLGEGSFFGEIALIYDSLRVCTVVAGTYCDLYVLTKEAFERIEEDYPDQVQRIRELADKRREGQKPAPKQNDDKHSNEEKKTEENDSEHNSTHEEGDNTLHEKENNEELHEKEKEEKKVIEPNLDKK